MLKVKVQQSYFNNLVKSLSNSLMKVEDAQPHVLYEHLMKNQQLINAELDDHTKSQLITFLGIHNSRKKYPQCKQIVHSLLKQTQVSVDQQDLPQTAISLSNLGIYDSTVLDQVHEQLKNTENPETKIILNLLWCFQKLEYKYDRSLFNDMIGKKTLQFNEYQRLIWMLSNEDSINSDVIQEKLDKYIKLSKKEQNLNFTPKVCYQICQTMFNIYPGLINVQLDDLKEFNKQDRNFAHLQESYMIARQVLQRNTQNIQQTNQEFYYFHKNQQTDLKDTVRNSHVFCLSPCTQAKNTSKFEMNIKSLLDELQIKYLKNQNISIYEVDFLMGKTVLEANGHSHFIWNTQDDKVTYTFNFRNKIKYKFNYRNRHLQELGFSDIVLLDSRKWEQLDPRQKQLNYLRNLLIK